MAFIVPFTECLHIGHFSIAGAQCKHVHICPHGKSTTRASSSIQILHKDCSLSFSCSMVNSSNSMKKVYYKVMKYGTYRGYSNSEIILKKIKSLFRHAWSVALFVIIYIISFIRISALFIQVFSLRIITLVPLFRFPFHFLKLVSREYGFYRNEKW